MEMERRSLPGRLVEIATFTHFLSLQSVVYRVVVWVSPGNLLEWQNVSPQPETAESNLHF